MEKMKKHERTTGIAFKFRFWVSFRRRWWKAISKNLSLETHLTELSAMSSCVCLPVVISDDFRNSRRNSSFLRRLPLASTYEKKKSEKEVDYESRLSKWYAISLCRNPQTVALRGDITRQMVIYLRMSNVNICHLKIWTRGKGSFPYALLLADVLQNCHLFFIPAI